MADRNWRFALGAIALSSLLFLVMSGAAQAALITVDNLSSTSVAGHCSLSDAVASANSHSTVGSSDCTAGTGSDTIEFSVTGTIVVTATLDITDAVLEIEGPTTAPGVQINGDAVEIFDVTNTTFILNNLTIMNGDATDGGAISADGDDLQINNCLFTDNSASFGGAIFAGAGTAEIINTTFGFNDATTLGGAIYNDSATVFLTNDTFVGNDAPSAGALYSDSPTHSKATIFKLGSGSNCGFASAGDAIDAGYNLSQDASCNLTAGTSLSSTAPGLNGSGLMHNGGPTQTVALVAGSRAIGLDGDCTDQAGNPVLTDQRLFGRPNSPTFCDAGAYEFDGVLGSFGFVPGTERMQVARSTTPDSDDLNFGVTFSESGACNPDEDALNGGINALVYPGTCADFVADTEVLDVDMTFTAHTVNHQSYGTFAQTTPNPVTAKIVTIEPASGDFCGEWTLNVEASGLDTTPLGNGPIALVLQTPDALSMGCLDINNAIIGNQIPPPIIPVVRRGTRR